METDMETVSIDIDLDYENDYIAQLLAFESSFDIDR